jgi:hypothetical protein
VDVAVGWDLARQSGQTKEVRSARHGAFTGAQPFQYLYVATIPQAKLNRPPCEGFPLDLDEHDRPAGVIDDCRFRHRRLDNARRREDPQKTGLAYRKNLIPVIELVDDLYRAASGIDQPAH